jgi:hypothetical protein
MSCSKTAASSKLGRFPNSCAQDDVSHPSVDVRVWGCALRLRRVSGVQYRIWYVDLHPSPRDTISRMTGCYLFMSVASVILLQRQGPCSAARRVLLPYTLIMLGLNTAFSILLSVYTEHITIEGSRSQLAILQELEGCDGDVVVRTVLRTMSILLNDLLFVSIMNCAFTILGPNPNRCIGLFSC